MIKTQEEMDMTEKKRLSGVEGQAGHPALCVLPEIEKEDELFEIIWTLREDGKSDPGPDRQQLRDPGMRKHPEGSGKERMDRHQRTGRRTAAKRGEKGTGTGATSSFIAPDVL